MKCSGKCLEKTVVENGKEKKDIEIDDVVKALWEGLVRRITGFAGPIPYTDAEAFRTGRKYHLIRWQFPLPLPFPR